MALLLLGYERHGNQMVIHAYHVMCDNREPKWVRVVLLCEAYTLQEALEDLERGRCLVKDYATWREERRR